MWRKADDYPITDIGKWSEEVVAVTNLGNVFMLSLFNGREDKVWQRPKAFENDERVAYWHYSPYSKRKS